MGSLTHPMKLSRARGIALAAVIGALALVLVMARLGNRALEPQEALAVETSSELPETATIVTEVGRDPQSLEPPPPLEPRVEATAPHGPHGQVLAAADGAALEGLTVRMRRGPRVLAETVTGRDGTFQLPRPERSGSYVDVSTEGWRTTPARVRLGEDQAQANEAIVFTAERVALAPLRGRLLDQATGEPIPYFLIRARGPCEPAQETWLDTPTGRVKSSVKRAAAHQRRENIVTDADGRFESAGGFESGTIELALIDDLVVNRSRLIELELAPLEILHAFEPGRAPKEHIVSIPIGPTYRFDVAIPDGLRATDFHAVFLDDTSGIEWMVHKLGSEDPSSAAAQFYEAGLEAMEPLTAVREGDHPWVRFRWMAKSLLSAEPVHEIHVRSSDGYWAGSTQVTSIQGVHPGLVPVRLERCGSIEGSVVGPAGRGVPSAWIELGPGAGAGEPIHQTGADRKGRFSFKWLPPGTYRLQIQTQRYEPWSEIVAVEAGSTSSVEATLKSGVALGTISGALRSRTGKHRSRSGIVVLRGLESEFHSIRTAEYRERDGEFVAPFSFADVPDGIYELTLIPLVNLRWNTLRMQVSPPADGLDFVCEDDVATFDLAFRAIDAETGRPIDKFWTLVWHGDPIEDARLSRDSETDLYPGVPEGAPIRWMARAKGYRLAWGDESAFEQEGDRRVVEARLSPGWGEIFKVTTRDGDAIPGVELSADGKPVGHTDARGMVILDHASKPERLEFRLEGWHVTWGRIDPSQEDFGWGPETPVHLGRD